MKSLSYAITDEGLVISRCDSEVAWPSLNYEGIGKDGDYTAPFTYHLRKISVFDVRSEWDTLIWTKKIPLEVRNKHRKFWGMEPLSKITPAQERWDTETGFLVELNQGVNV